MYFNDGVTMKKTLILCILTACAIFLNACKDDDKTIKIGVIAGPETELAEVAAQVAKKQYGLNVKIVSFSDYLQPNAALDEGSLQANAFQHLPYLEEQVATYRYDLAVAGKTFVYPMGVYSSFYESLTDVPENSQVAIPNDPTNKGRALLLLQSAGLITLQSKTNLHAMPKDVVENPKNLQFVELDAAQLARAYKDIAVAVINTNYAISEGLYPSKNALYLENKNSLYANLIVIRQADINKPWVKPLVESFQSQAVIDKANELFQEQAIPAFTPTTGTSLESV